MYQDTNSTDFDLFLSGFDSSSKSSSGPKKTPHKSNAATFAKTKEVKASTSSDAMARCSNTAEKVSKKAAKALDFDAQLLEIDEQCKAKKLSKSKSESKLVEKKGDTPIGMASKETPMKKVVGFLCLGFCEVPNYAFVYPSV